MILHHSLVMFFQCSCLYILAIWKSDFMFVLHIFLLFVFMFLIVWIDSIKSTFIFVSISHLGVRFLWELNVDYPFFSRSQRLPISCWLRLWIAHLFLMSFFTVFIIMSTSMDKVFIIHRNLEHENQALCESMAICKSIKFRLFLGCVSTTQPQPKEPHINLIDKFDGTCSKFQGFVNQMHLVMWLHLHRYPTSPIQIEFIGTLLLGWGFAWFTPLLKH